MSIVLDRLSEPGLDRQETGMRIIAALDDGATLEEIAARLGRPVQEIERVYAPAINEAGRLGQVKDPAGPVPIARDVPDQLYVDDTE